VTAGAPDEQSLARLADVVHPALGGRRLLAWLLGAPAPAAELAARRASVGALRERHALLLDVAAEARHGGAPVSASALAAFRAWCDDATGGAGGAGVAPWVAAACTAALAAVVVALGRRAGRAAATLLVLAQLVLAGLARRRLQRGLRGLDASLAPLAGAVRVMARVVAEPPVDGRLGAVQRRLGDERAVAAFGALVRLLEWNEVHRSPMAHWALNAAVALDVHLGGGAGAVAARAPRAGAGVARRGRRRRGAAGARRAGRRAPGVVDPGGARRRGRAAGGARARAPAAAADAAVPSDATLRAAGDVLVVTGPNMAGKTTFLRALGLAALLAQAGGAVPATSLRLRRCRVRTSVRVEDDLARGVSLFFAEVDAAARRRARGGGRRRAAGAVPVRRGAARHQRGGPALATRTVLAALRRAGAAGAVTTHDPGVAALAGAPPQEVHFDGPRAARRRRRAVAGVRLPRGAGARDPRQRAGAAGADGAAGGMRERGRPLGLPRLPVPRGALEALGVQPERPVRAQRRRDEPVARVARAGAVGDRGPADGVGRLPVGAVGDERRRDGRAGPRHARELRAPRRVGEVAQADGHRLGVLEGAQPRLGGLADGDARRRVPRQRDPARAGPRRRGRGTRRRAGSGT
jgi:hypothetical protein